MRVIRVALSVIMVAGGLACGRAVTEPVKIDRPFPKGRIPAAPRLVPVKNSRVDRQTSTLDRYLVGGPQSPWCYVSRTTG